ncbi:ABC transporter permease [Alkaliphilus crotonatoxidans]
MTVYKAFFKVIYKNITQMLIYIVVFLSLAMAMANTNTISVDTDFTKTKVNLAYINDDTDSWLARGLRDYIGENANIVTLSGDLQSLQDALFFREVEYIVRVPEGFTKAFLTDQGPQLEKSTIPSSASEIYIDSLINKYLNTVKTYTDHTTNLTEEELLKLVQNDLAEEVEVTMSHPMAEVNKNQKRVYYFNYMSYALFAVLILGVCTVMMVFNQTDLKRRNLCSPLGLKNMNFQMILGNISYAVLAWLVMILPSFFLYGSFMLTPRGLLFLLNSLVFTLTALSISFLLGNVIRGKNAMSAAANVFALGTSFISGVFVPQALLGKGVLKIASFTPNYWYVKSNHMIAALENYHMESLRPLFTNMLIMIGFTVAVLSVSIMVIKQRQVEN